MNTIAKNSGVVFPQSVEHFKQKWPAFAAWLKAKGSEVFQPTGYEVAKFTTPQGVGIILRNISGVIRPNMWQGGSASAWIAWRKKDGDWRVGVKTKGAFGAEKTILIEAIAARDGWSCCYCHTKLNWDTATLEHFCPRTAEGPDHIANCGIACADCNEGAGCMSVAEKIRFAQKKTDQARVKWKEENEKAAARLWAFIAERNLPPQDTVHVP